MTEREILSITGGPHQSDRSWAEMERFGKSLRHQNEAIWAVAAEVNYTKLPRIMAEDITFRDRDCVGTDYPHTDALVISARIELMKVH